MTDDAREHEVEQLKADLDRARATTLSWMDSAGDLVARYEELAGELAEERKAHQATKADLQEVGSRAAEEARLRGGLEVQAAHRGEILAGLRTLAEVMAANPDAGDERHDAIRDTWRNVRDYIDQRWPNRG